MTAVAMDGSTDQKVGGSSPSERTPKLLVRPERVKAVETVEF